MCPKVWPAQLFSWSEILNVTIVVKDCPLYPDFANFCFQNRLNVTKTIRKFSIDSNLRPTGSEFHSGEVLSHVNHDEAGEEVVEDSVSLTSRNFDTLLHQ